ncbi:MAG: hypothetical protein ACRDKT_00380 [Actinomycetota bacterium]
MADGNDRVQEALAAYFDHLEIGGPKPDFSHLSADEARELQELIDDLELTEGVAFGSGREEAAAAVQVAATADGERLLEELRSSLPPGVRIDPDDNRFITQIGGIDILDRAILGTFGGRVRIWLLDVDTAGAIEENARTLSDVGGVFGMFPDMSAVALVGRDLSCVIVEPQDTSPQIQVPSGSLIARRYKRAIQPVAEAVPAFLDELIPYWDPMPAFDPDSGIAIDIAEISDDLADAAIERQRKIGERARKGNPKKDALLAFGDKEASTLRSLTKGLFDGSVDPSQVETRIEKAAGR